MIALFHQVHVALELISGKQRTDPPDSRSQFDSLRGVEGHDTHHRIFLFQGFSLVLEVCTPAANRTGASEENGSFASYEGPPSCSMTAGCSEGGLVQVLVAYGSKRGGTAGLAEMIGDELAAAGLETTVAPAHDVRRLEATTLS